MAEFYSEMAAMARDLLDPTSAGGLGQGNIELRRTTLEQPTQPWLPPVSVTQSETLRGAVRGVDKRLVGAEVGGTVLLMSDRVAICEVPKMQYTAGDVLAVDGKPVHIIVVENIPAAGVTSAVRFTIRGG